MKQILPLFILLFFSCKKEKNSAYSKCPKSFETFFSEFSKDSIYQKNSIHYPLDNSYLDNNYENLIHEKINSSKNFEFIDFSNDNSAMKQEIDKYTVAIEKTKDGYLYKRIGYDNGILITYKFQFIDECWLLVAIIDQST